MKALNGQSLIDLAIQTAGSAEAAYDLVVANGFSVTDEIAPGTELKEVDILNKNVSGYFTHKNLKPATAATKFQTPQNRFWFIEMPIEFE